MKKVLMFCPIEFSGGYKGGVASIIESYSSNSKYFKKNDYYIEVFTGDRKINAPKSIISKMLYHVGYIIRYRKIIKKMQSKFDLLHIHTSRDLRLFDDLKIASYIKKHYQIPVVMTIHRSELEKTITGNKYLQFYFLRMLRRIDKLIFLSEEAKRQFEQQGIEKASCLANFHSYSKTAQINIKHDNTFRMLFVGFYNKEKGLVELLDAMKKLPENVILDLCGGRKDGDSLDVDSMISEYGSRVINHGYVLEKEKEAVFSNADVFILPSYGEGLPLVVLEALHFGLPIIITPVGSIPEILVENQNALFITPRSVESIVTKVTELMLDKEKQVQMRFANALLSEEYCLEENINRLCSIYNELELN